MRPSAVPLDHLEQLPVCHRVTIPSDYLDILGHMNVQWYFAIYNRAAMAMMGSFGLNEDYIHREKCGNFVLRQVINYINEVREGETIEVRGRILGRSEKRLHKMYFMINETRRTLASTSEVLTSHVDLVQRRSSPFPPGIATDIDRMIVEFTALEWDAPKSGIIQP